MRIIRRSRVVLATSIVVSMLSFVSTTAPAVATVTQVKISYSGAPQSVGVPSGTCRVIIQAQGGQGGKGDRNAGSFGTGGYGGFVDAMFSISSGSTLNVNVGGGGGQSDNSDSINYPGGYNGGGAGGMASSWENGGAGGGMTTVGINGSTVVIAGGGGGGGALWGADSSDSPGTAGSGGNGGVIVGNSIVAMAAQGGVGDSWAGAISNPGQPGTQVSGGAGGAGNNVSYAGQSGGSGTGGNAGNNSYDWGAGGGGAGYFGGGGASGTAGGGGGSSWVAASALTPDDGSGAGSAPAQPYFGGWPTADPGSVTLIFEACGGAYITPSAPTGVAASLSGHVATLNFDESGSTDPTATFACTAWSSGSPVATATPVYLYNALYACTFSSLPANTAIDLTVSATNAQGTSPLVGDWVVTPMMHTATCVNVRTNVTVKVKGWTPTCPAHFQLTAYR